MSITSVVKHEQVTSGIIIVIVVIIVVIVLMHIQEVWHLVEF